MTAHCHGLGLAEKAIPPLPTGSLVPPIRHMRAFESLSGLCLLTHSYSSSGVEPSVGDYVLPRSESL